MMSPTFFQRKKSCIN